MLKQSFAAVALVIGMAATAGRAYAAPASPAVPRARLITHVHREVAGPVNRIPGHTLTPARSVAAGIGGLGLHRSSSHQGASSLGGPGALHPGARGGLHDGTGLINGATLRAKPPR